MQPDSPFEERTEPTDFDRWLAAEFERTGAFTTLAVLIEIAGRNVKPLCSTYFHVIDDAVDWAEIDVLFAGAFQSWDGAAFFSLTAAGGGPLDNPTAHIRLRELEARFDDDRLALNEGHFFDNLGRRLKTDEVMPR